MKEIAPRSEIELKNNLKPFHYVYQSTTSYVEGTKAIGSYLHILTEDDLPHAHKIHNVVLDVNDGGVKDRVPEVEELRHHANDLQCQITDILFGLEWGFLLQNLGFESSWGVWRGWEWRMDVLDTNKT